MALGERACSGRAGDRHVRDARALRNVVRSDGPARSGARDVQYDGADCSAALGDSGVGAPRTREPRKPEPRLPLAPASSRCAPEG